VGTQNARLRPATMEAEMAANGKLEALVAGAGARLLKS
jgi:hypothetical protein